MKKIFKKDYIRKTTDNKWVLVYILTAFLAGLLTAGVFIKAYTFFSNYNQPQDLLSPLSEVGGLVVKPVYAKEKINISCDNPKGYLECQVYKKIITWEDYDKLFQLVDRCENPSWNPNATHINTNGSIDRGIFQINNIHKSLTNVDAFDFRKNIDFAIQLYKKQGVHPWSCSKKLNIR